MLVYWGLFFLSFLGAMQARTINSHALKIPLFTFTIFLMILIGLRFDVGGDWISYLNIFNNIEYQLQQYSFKDVALINSNHDLGYVSLNIFMSYAGLGIYGVNLVCAVIFSAGLLVFARTMPFPWLALLVAIPYLIIVVSMGYTRQAVAIGFEFFALVALARSQQLRFYSFIVLGALFHKTIIILSLLGLFSGKNKTSWFKILLGLVISYIAIKAMFAEHYASFMVNYVDAQMQSSGAKIRVAMNVLPAIIFIIYYKQWKKSVHIESYWPIIVVVAIICLPLVFAASTAVDRMALYVIPLQLYVWSHLPMVLRSLNIRIAIIAYHAVVMFVWLNYATHAKYWLPYQNVLFVW